MPSQLASGADTAAPGAYTRRAAATQHLTRIPLRAIRQAWRTPLWGVALVLAGCNGAGAEAEIPEGIIEADAFIDTYVDLRIAALTNVTGEITEAERDSVLNARGVRSAEMLEFAEAHGRRAAYMQNVWDSVEVRFQRRRDELNTEAAGR